MSSVALTALAPILRHQAIVIIIARNVRARDGHYHVISNASNLSMPASKAHQCQAVEKGIKS